MSNPDIDIAFYKEKFVQARNKLIEVILDSIVDEETFWKYYYQLHSVTLNDGWVDDCPESIYKWIDCDRDRNKGEIFYFDNELESMLDYKKDEEYCEKYLSETEIELINSKTAWEFMQEILDYTREHKRSGTFFDW